MRFLLGLLVATLLPAGLAALPVETAPAPRRVDAKELERLRGEWTLVRETTYAGRVNTYGGPKDSSIGHWTLTFEGKKFVLEEDYTDPPYVTEGTITLDTDRRPKRIDLTVVVPARLAESDLKGQSRLGVYELDGDRLKICLTWYGSTPRPTGFEHEENQAVYEFKRVKK